MKEHRSALVAQLSAILRATALVSLSHSAFAAPAAAARRSIITIRDFSFHPGVLTVASGTVHGETVLQ
ncbi:MAG: hypothetical protein WBW93_08590 [Steroidobacteraceae bacterium]